MKTEEKKFNGIEELVLELDMARIIFAEEEEEEEEARIVVSIKDITERKRAEEALRIQNKIFAQVLNGLNALVYVVDIKTYEVLFINTYGENIWGDIKGEICWQTIQTDRTGPCEFCTNSQLVGPDGAPTEGVVWEFQNTVNKRWYDCRDRAIYWPDGRTVRMEIATDITERKRLEALLADIIRQNPMSIQIVDKEGFTLQVNPTHTMLFGAVPPASFSIFADLSRRSPEFEKLIQRVKNGEVVNFPDTYYNPHEATPEVPDNPVWLRAMVFPLKNESGKAEKFVCMHENISERVKAAAELKKNETLLDELANRVPGVVYQFYARPNGKRGFYYISRKSEQVLGLSSDLEGYLERFVSLIIPEYREDFIKSIEKSVKEAGEWSYEGMLQKPSGDKIWFSGSSVPSPRKNEIVFNGIVTDITRRKEMEKRLVEAEKLDAIGYFITGTAHELNNPLATIISFAETMRNKLKAATVDAGKLRESTEIMLRNAVRCEAIVTSLMSYGKTQVSQFVPMDINKLIEKAMTLAEGYCSLGGIDIRTHYSASLPLVIGNKEQMTQVFTNIIRNAAQSMHGHGTLRIDTKTGDNNVHAVFTDSGEGIAPDKLSKVFDPFFTTREPGQGTGLGLAVSSGIIRSHNGKISAASKGKGKGASFTVSLPIPTEDVKHD